MRKLGKNDLIKRSILNSIEGGSTPFQFLTKREPQAYLVLIQQAGVDPRNLELSIRNKSLQIHHRFAKQSALHVSMPAKEEESQYFPEMVHTLQLPPDIDYDKVEARVIGKKLEVYLPIIQRDDYERKIHIEE